MSTTLKALRPVKVVPKEWDKVEERIKTLFKRELYRPILEALGLDDDVKLRNDKGALALLKALERGTLTYSDGVFSGRFRAETTKELKRLGATWDRKTGAFKLAQSKLPPEIRAAIAASQSRFLERLSRVDKAFDRLVPAEIAGKLKVSDLFDSTLWKVDRQLSKTLVGLTVPPQLTPERRRRIADEWATNMDLWVKDFTEKEILRLREQVKKVTFSGNRFETLVKTIQASYGVSARKAKFLARQETNLLLTKFKETRYVDAGVYEYRWRCVAGSPAHPVRPSHKALDGKVFRWDDPPITTAPGEPVRRNNPGQDYNCRCGAIPLIRKR